VLLLADASPVTGRLNALVSQGHLSGAAANMSARGALTAAVSWLAARRTAR
jgi:hypothetical protein